MEHNVEIGIIGGTGSDITLEDEKRLKVYTPYGAPSDLVSIGYFKGKKVAFLPRHGKDHRIPPHMLNFRANVWAMKSVGVQRIISPSAVGSLREELNKGQFVICDQYIDRTRTRISTFYEGGSVCHISQADPYCNTMNEIFYSVGKEIGIPITKGGTYVCIEGPRFSTRAESKVFRMWGGDVIGMTCYPEVTLAAEQAMCYATIAMVTDLDVWAAQCDKCGVVEFGKTCNKCGGSIRKLAVSIDEVLETMKTNAINLKKLLETAIPKIPTERECSCKDALKGAIL
ncbi:MAG: S-methyl-5'-thioadenosine phosphorylase [Candidatus Lokiarchaeota archaeon]|nr:S-methyl-5'-thioadenosine phosphorylase [Candidatus Lokiarchaeota archaeon]